MLKKSDTTSQTSDKELSLSLSLDKFEELFKPILTEKEEESKLKYLINDVSYIGKVENDAILINVKFTLESFTKDYQLIDLIPKDSIIKTKKLPSKVNLGLYNNYYYIVLNSVGKFEIEFSVYLQYNSKNGINSFNFNSIASGSFSLTIPSENAILSIENIENIKHHKAKNETTAETNISKGALSIYWKDDNSNRGYAGKDDGTASSLTEIKGTLQHPPKDDGTPSSPEKKEEKKIDPIIYSEVKTSISVNETIIQCNSNIDYKVYKAGVNHFELEVLGGKIVNIDAPFIKNYDIENIDNLSKVTIYTSQIIYNSFNLNIIYEETLEINENEGNQVLIPMLKSNNVNRETGKISLSSSSNIELSIIKQDKLVTMDISELPSEFKTDLSLGSLLAFKYFLAPYSLNIQVIKHKELPVVVAISDYAMLTTVLLKEGKLLNQIDLKLRNNSQTFIKYFLPLNAIPLSAMVNKNSVKPVKGEDDSIMIPIDKSSDGEKFFEIKFLFNIELEKMDDTGEIEIKLGSLDIPIKKLYWELYFPDIYKYKKFKGNLEKVDTFNYDQEIRNNLPLNISIPKLGEIYRFEDYFLNGEELSLKFKYSKIFKLFKSNNVQPL